MGVTSTQSPIRVSFVPGHLTGVSGRIGLTLGPGKRDGRWQRELEQDLRRLRDVYRTDLLVSLMLPDERRALGMGDLPERAADLGLDFHELPVADGSVPSLAELEGLARTIVAAAAVGRNVVVHCRGGLGRSGLAVAACLRARGIDAEHALEAVRRARPGAVETPEQAALIATLPPATRAPLPVAFERFRGCLLGGAVGDALGYPIEFDNHQSIVTRWGEAPPAPLAYADAVPALVSDDTQMTLFTAEGLIAQPEPDDPLEGIHRAYLRWLTTQTGAPGPAGGWLLSVERLHARRAPGNTCLSSLIAQNKTPHRPSVSAPPNDSKGCGAIMRSAPIGLGASSRDAAFELGRDAGVLTHGHPSGYLSAAYFASLIYDLSRGGDLREAMDAADALLACEFGAAETQRFVALAKELALGGPPAAADLEALGGGWTGESALAIALACVLPSPGGSPGEVASTLWRAVAHGGDSDSTGSLVGNLLGALHGDTALPPRWLDEVELRDVTESLASDLYDHSVLGSRMDHDRYG